jgi:hypothetical protein
MNSQSRNTQPISDEAPDVYLEIFGLPNLQDAVHPQGSHENTFDHQPNLSTGNHMPPYNGDRIVSLPYPQWGGPSHAWNHPNINASESYGSSAVSYCLLLTVDFI